MIPTPFAHVALNCLDPSVTEQFYCQHFGFKRARVVELPDAQIVFLRSGSVYLELFQAQGSSRLPVPIQDPAPINATVPIKDGPATPGVRHLAFQVSDVDAKLSEMGSAAVVTFGPFSFADFIPGWRTVWIRDPDGNVVEISQGFTDQANPPPLLSTTCAAVG